MFPKNKAYPKKTNPKKTPTRWSDSKKSDFKKSDFKKPDFKKSGFKKADTKWSDSKKTDTNRTDNKKIDTKWRPKEPLFIWGRHPVETFLASLHQAQNLQSSSYVLHVIVDKAGKTPAQLMASVESADALGIKIISHNSSEEEWPLAHAEDFNHQRICLKVPEYPVKTIYDAVSIIKKAIDEQGDESPSKCYGIVLDQVQDPRNFGAILRSASFFGVKFVVYGTNRQSEITSLVLKASAGGAFSLALIPVVNINRALEQLKDAGVWIVGTALTEKSISLKDLPRDRQWVAVVGNEAQGLRAEVLKNCDYVVKVPGETTAVDSLNVSVATGIVLHSLQGSTH